MGTSTEQFNSVHSQIASVARLTQCIFEKNACAFEKCQLEARDLLRQVLLHLPRLEQVQLQHNSFVLREIARLSEWLLEGRRSVPPSLFDPNADALYLDDLVLGLVAPDVTRAILAHYHYLRHPRDYVFSLGLASSRSDQARSPVALFTLSELDVPHIIRMLPRCVQREEVLVLSRVYASRIAPKNTLSYGLRLLRHWLAKEAPHVRLLLTYINPNLGFDAASLRASNWSLFCREKRDHYLYLNDFYITDRECSRRFGSDSYEILRSIVGAKISRSRAKLQPLQMHSYFLQRRDRRIECLQSFGDREIDPRRLKDVGVSDECIDCSIST